MRQLLIEFMLKYLMEENIPQLPHHFKDTLRIAAARLTNLQSKKRAWIVGKEHYDLGNDLFSLMLDPYMQYSCGYWKEATTLATAQEAKLDMICRKLALEPGMSLLDIGCGWGIVTSNPLQRCCASFCCSAEIVTPCTLTP